jgi:membrane protein DedA with SNARE-associated domain
VEAFIADYGLLALFVLMVLDNMAVPFPSEIPLLLTGVSIRQGQMAPVPAVLVAGIGSLVGALVLYLLARTIGHAAIVRWGRRVRVNEEDLARAEAWFHRRGEIGVLLLRMVPLARTLISIPAGVLEMSAIRFTLYTFGGSLAWGAFVIGLGWGLGDSYERVTGAFGLAGVAVASTIVMVVVIWFLARRRRPR